MKWLAGGTRRKIAGDLPKYPEGVRVEAEIRLFAIVSPGGLIEALHPAQKQIAIGGCSAERSAVLRFEPLKSSQPQVSQTVR